jgi:hypothetical protein
MIILPKKIYLSGITFADIYDKFTKPALKEILKKFI